MLQSGGQNIARDIPQNDSQNIQHGGGQNIAQSGGVAKNKIVLIPHKINNKIVLLPNSINLSDSSIVSGSSGSINKIVLIPHKINNKIVLLPNSINLSDSLIVSDSLSSSSSSSSINKIVLIPHKINNKIVLLPNSINLSSTSITSSTSSTSNEIVSSPNSNGNSTILKIINKIKEILKNEKGEEKKNKKKESNINKIYKLKKYAKNSGIGIWDDVTIDNISNKVGKLNLSFDEYANNLKNDLKNRLNISLNQIGGDNSFMQFLFYFVSTGFNIMYLYNGIYNNGINKNEIIDMNIFFHDNSQFININLDYNKFMQLNNIYSDKGDKIPNNYFKYNYLKNINKADTNNFIHYIKNYELGYTGLNNKLQKLENNNKDYKKQKMDLVKSYNQILIDLGVENNTIKINENNNNLDKCQEKLSQFIKDNDGYITYGYLKYDNNEIKAYNIFNKRPIATFDIDKSKNDYTDKSSIKTNLKFNNTYDVLNIKYFIVVVLSNLIWYCTQYTLNNDSVKKVLNASQKDIDNIKYTVNNTHSDILTRYRIKFEHMSDDFFL